MRLGQRLSHHEHGWTGIIKQLLDDDGDRVASCDNPAAVVIFLDEPDCVGQRWMTINWRALRLKPRALH